MHVIFNFIIIPICGVIISLLFINISFGFDYESTMWWTVESLSIDFGIIMLPNQWVG